MTPLLLTLALMAAEAPNVEDKKPAALQDVGIDQRLNENVPLDLVFRDEEGHDVKLGDYFGKRPVILVLAYYQCPMLCTQVLNGLAGGLERVPFKMGEDYEVVTVSFDAREVPALAAEKKKAYAGNFARGGADKGWHFLTGAEPSIQALTKALGFRYRYDERTQQFAHASGIMLLTPEGKIARYFFGISFSPADLRLGLVDVAAGKISSPIDQILLYCYSYDPKAGKYTASVMIALRIGAVLTVIGLCIFLTLTWRRDRQLMNKTAVPAGGA